MAKTISENIERRLDSFREKLGEKENEWLSDLSLSVSPSTAAEYAKDLNLFRVFIISRYPVDNWYRLVRKRDITDFLRSVTNHNVDFLTTSGNKKTQRFTNSAYGQSRKLAVLRQFFSWLIVENMIQNNPVAHVKIKPPNAMIKPRISNSEAKALIDILKVERKLLASDRATLYHLKHKDRNLAILEILITTGIRVGELVNLNIEDLDMNSWEMKIRRKGGDEATVVIPLNYRKSIMKYLEKDNRAQGPLFLSMRGERMGSKTVEIMLKRLRVQAGINTPLTPHTLRRYFGTKIYRKTGDIGLTAELLGHKDINTTRKHYADPSEARKREVMESFSI